MGDPERKESVFALFKGSVGYYPKNLFSYEEFRVSGYSQIPCVQPRAAIHMGTSPTGGNVIFLPGFYIPCNFGFL